MEKNTNELCPCGKAQRISMERIPRNFIMKVFLFWLPIKRYKCYACMSIKWLLEDKSSASLRT